MKNGGDFDDYLQRDPSSSDSFAENLEFYFGSLDILNFVKASIFPPHRHPEQSPIKKVLISLLIGFTLCGEEKTPQLCGSTQPWM